MSSKNLNLRQDYQANLPRTGFDMSRHFTFTSSVGMILPVYHDFLSPGETVKIDCSMFTRMQPVITAAMADIDQKIDWFFVPASMLYTIFPSSFFNTNDFLSAFHADIVENRNVQANMTKFPLFNLPDVRETLEPYGDFASLDSMRYLFGDDDTDNVSSENFESIMCSAYRLLNMLGIPPRYLLNRSDLNSFISQSISEQTAGGSESPVGNIYPQITASSDFLGKPLNFWYTILAYNAVYQHYYRPEEYEKLDVKSYNVDNFFGSAPQTLAVKYCLTRYHTRYKDYFNSGFLSPITQTNNLFNSSSNDFNGMTDLTNFAGLLNSFYSIENSEVGFQYNSRGDFNPNSHNYVGTFAFLNNGNDNTTTGIRASFAMEKYLRILGRARKSYDAQVLAHFGYKVPHDVMHQISYIGGFNGELHIGAVISTADTLSADGGSPVGEIGGNGTGQLNGRPVKFTAPCHGVLIATMYSLPRQPLEYAYGLDKSNVIQGREDLFIPEFDKLGMQPLFQYEYNPRYTQATTSFERWQYRYSQWKRKYDVFSMAFIDSGRGNAYGQGNGGVNIYSAWITGRKPMIQNDAGNNAWYTPTWDMFCPPTAINSIMQIPYSGAFTPVMLTFPWLMFQTDPFIHDLQCNVYKVSCMSTFGEPDLDR